MKTTKIIFICFFFLPVVWGIEVYSPEKCELSDVYSNWDYCPEYHFPWPGEELWFDDDETPWFNDYDVPWEEFEFSPEPNRELNVEPDEKTDTEKYSVDDFDKTPEILPFQPPTDYSEEYFH